MRVKVFFERTLRLIAVGLFLLVSVCAARAVPSQVAPTQQLTIAEQWRLAVLAGDLVALKQMFSTNPAPQIKTAGDKVASVDDEVIFWAGWKAKGLTDVRLDIAQDQNPNPNVHVLLLQVVLTTVSAGTTKKFYVAMAQGWLQQGPAWHLAYVQRQDAARLEQPLVQKDLYPASADAKVEIAESVRKAAAAHKRVLLVFGANWCYDCHVLDEAFHSPDIWPLVDKSFELVHVDIGQMDKNLEVAKQYDVPLDRGVPAIAVLDSDGKLLFSQKRGEFEAARSMAPEDILDFLNKWKSSSAKN